MVSNKVNKQNFNSSQLFKSNPLNPKNENLEWEIITKGEKSYFQHISDGRVFTVGGLSYEEPREIKLPNNKSIHKIIPANEDCVFYMDSDGDCFVEGVNTSGELGLGSESKAIEESPALLNLPNGNKISEIVSGYYITFLRDKNGNWFGCGSNGEGQLGISKSINFAETPLPIVLPSKKQIMKIVPSHSHTFMRDNEGNWYGCGYGGNGELGCKNVIKRFVPTLVNLPNGKKIADIVVGHNTTFMKDVDNNWYSCGKNDDNQLGFTKKEKYSECIFSPTLIQLPNSKIIADIIPGSSQTFIKDTEGCWYGIGQNYCGQLGLGEERVIDTPTPIPFPNDASIQKIIPGMSHAFAMDKKHNWYGCGRNGNLELGFNKGISSQPSFTPIDFSDFINKLEVNQRSMVSMK